MNVLTTRAVVAAAVGVLVVATASADAATARRAPSSSPGAAKAAIRHVWTTFFNGRVPPAERIRVLQNGQRFAALIKSQAASQVARQAKATVASVSLVGEKRALVVYTIWVASLPTLKNVRGIAVRVGSAWKVSTQTFCELQALQGQTPPGC
jgi:hypothetical protein